MEGNILLRLSEMARKAVIKSNNNPEHQFAVRKVLSLMLWILGEWQLSVEAKVKASKALEDIWDAVLMHIDTYLVMDNPDNVHAVINDMTEYLKRNR